MAVTLSFITYPDRVCVSIAAPKIMRDLSLKSMQMSFVSSAFTATCAFFKITVGWRGRAS
jgi:ACS family glucarate transporter-like MFS transporter